MRKIRKLIRVRRKRAKPFQQKHYSNDSIILKIGIAALIVLIILAIIIVCTYDF